MATIRPKEGSSAGSTNKRIKAAELSDVIIQNTKYIRGALDKHPHFVHISLKVIEKLLDYGLHTVEDSEKSAIANQVYNYFISKYPIGAPNTILLEELSSISSAKGKTLGGATNLGLYYRGKFLGVLASNFSNASTMVVREIQNITGVDLAVGHMVGAVEVQQSKTGDYAYIHNNMLLRSPGSMKLAIIQEVFSIADHVNNNDLDSLVNWYFNIDDKGRCYPKANFFIFKNAIETSKGTVFSGDLSKDEFIKENGIARSKVIDGFKSFNTKYVKQIKKKVFEGSDPELSFITSQISSAINAIAKEHEKYYNDICDSIVFEKEFTEKLVSLKIIMTIPQAERFNSGELAAIERRFSKAALESDPINFSKSPSIKSYIRDTVVNALNGNTTDKYKGKSKPEVSKKAPQSTGIKIPSGVSQKQFNRPKTSLPTLRNTQGQFTSLTRLETLLRAGLQQALLKNMQRPNLRNQTGRFRESVQLEKVSRERDGSLRAFLSYMKYPYATFERGGRQGHKGYYPSRLIDQSVRELATTLVRERMRVTVQ